MLEVGLTGGIGAGKSTVARRLVELGATLVDSDVLAREVVAAGEPALERVRERFGDAVIAGDGSLDRAALGTIVFGDDGARRDLESILHPAIRDRARALTRAAGRDAIVVQDVPLLVEKHMGPAFHLVVVVDADEGTRVERLVRDRGMTRDEARARMRAQATTEQRRAAADVWVDNSGEPEATTRAVDCLWHQRLEPYAANLRAGHRVRRSETLVLVEPQPGWADEGRRLTERLQHVLRDRALTVDHIGSTSIPGLVAKDVIDLQVGVASLEGADDDGFVRDLAAAGFPRVQDQNADHSKDGSPWPKRFHGGCDPARVVHVHVREVGSPGWRWALLFRDWLREDADARREYAALKVGLASRLRSVTDYAEA
jgi:dephospho-CoA kinase